MPFPIFVEAAIRLLHIIAIPLGRCFKHILCRGIEVGSCKLPKVDKDLAGASRGEFNSTFFESLRQCLVLSNVCGGRRAFLVETTCKILLLH